MDVLFIIGLPTQLQRRLEAVAGNDVRVRAVRMGVGKKNKPMLLPHPSTAVYTIKEWADDVDGHTEAVLVALPYASIPDELEDEIKRLEAVGVEVIRPVAGEEDWPGPGKDGVTAELLDGVFARLKEIVAPGEPGSGLKPSEHFAWVCEAAPNLLLTSGALDAIDDIAPMRFKFMRDAADKLAELARRKGDVGALEDFFHPLNLALSGGIEASVEVHRGSKRLYKASTHAHLKKGDNTSGRSAVRVYFHYFAIACGFYVAVLYAGPHPNKDVSRRYDLPPLPVGRD